MKTAAALCSVILLMLTGAEAATLQLDMVSDPGDFVGQGRTWAVLYDTERGSDISPEVRRTLVTGEPSVLAFVTNKAAEGAPGDFSHGMLLFGTSGLNIPVQPGIYTDAHRADPAIPGHPGLGVGFQARASGEVTGSFTISELTFDEEGFFVQTFGAVFELHSEGATGSLRGTVRYDLNPVPEPSAWTLAALAGGALLLWRGRK